jgi:hypothetical protein
MTPPAPIEIRKYPSLAAFQADAASMAAAGWRVVAQSSGSTMSSAGQWCVAFGILGALIGLVGVPVLLIGGLILVLIGAFSRQSTFTVTYQPDTTKPPTAA